MAALSIAVPVTVASIGTFEYAVQLAGQSVGLAGTPALDAAALSLGFLFHGLNLLSFAVWGGLGLVATGISLGDVVAVKKTEPEHDETT
jgi:hypothetical protein